MKASKHTKLWEMQRDNKDKQSLCKKCGKIREVTVDHIIPVHLLHELGLFDESENDTENFELLCILCNRFKGGRIDMSHPKTIPLLKKYINSL
jgi:5-methylcytosine-specific restriction endonuclease McrA